MDLIGLGSNFETISYIPYTNLQWNRRYYECGKWSAQIEESEYDPRIKYVYTPERPELGLVERMESSDTIKGKFVQISGYFIEHIFDRQIAFPPIEGSFRLHDLVYQFVSRSWYKPDLYTIEPASNLPTDTVDVKWENEKIGKLMYETLKTLEYSPRLIYNPTTNKFIFSIWQGKDRTQSQSSNAFVTFADDSCNVEKLEYIEDESNFKNVVMILYGEQPSRYDVYGDLTTEKGRRWLLLTGGSEEELAEYKQKAKEELSKYPIVQTANVEVIQDGLYYMIDYDLGDKCDIVSHRHQKAFEARLIEVDEVWKSGQHNVKLKFGETSKTVYQKLQRSIATERYAHAGTGGVAGSGIPGADGKDGVGIASVQQTTTSTADNGENIITVMLTDGSANHFSVRNGSKGSTGDTGPAGAAGKDGSPGKDGADGKDGSDGYTPVRGVDYWTAEDKEEIIKEVSGSAGGGGSVNEIATLTAEEYEALTTEEKAALYAQGVRVIAVESAFDADSLTDMQRFAAFAHPVGEIVELTVATNPAALWGFGTWESFMPGRVLVGAGTADSGTVYTAGATGGEEKHTLIEAEIPKLSGSMAMHGAENTSKGSNWWNPTGVFGNSELHNVYVSPSNGTTGATSVSYVSFNAGGDQPHNIMQPYGVVYRWLRTA